MSVPRLRRPRLRFPFAGTVGLVVLGAVVLCAIAAPLLAPHDPYAQELASAGLPPAWERGGAAAHPLGTDHLGRDELSRLIYGARVSILIGVSAVLIQTVIGLALGLLAGMRGGVLDSLVMRVADVWLSIPMLVIALAVMAILGGGVLNTVLILGFTGWVTFARVVRGEVIVLRQREFVTAATIFGASRWRIVRENIVRNAAPSVIVVATLQVSHMIVIEASLSFLGVGVQPPTPAWGSMIAQGREHLYTHWWQAVLPGLALMLTAMAVNLVGDALRDKLDPRLRAS